jgi:hypothetical protein
MGKAKRISVEQCCIYYGIETSFVQQLDEHGLTELTRSSKNPLLTMDNWPILKNISITMFGSSFEHFKKLTNAIQAL